MGEDGDDGESTRPFAGMVLCCTSIAPEQRTELATAAVLLGAKHSFDLTSGVTHLLVGNWNTQKHRYVAKERPDVHCLKPSFVTAAHAAWVQGVDSLDVSALEQEHCWPTLCGVRVCLTGFQDQQFRQEVERRVIQEGGEYRGDLTREVTHLIALEPRGAKYVHAKQWGVKCVTIEWLQDTLERGMVLEDQFYEPGLPSDEIGVGAWVRKEIEPKVVANKRKSAGGEDSQQPARKLRRTASAKFSSQNENIWGDIVGGGFGTKQARRDAWEESTADESRPDSRATPRLDSRPQSRAESRDGTVPPPSVLQRSVSAPQLQLSAKGMFEGKTFYLHGFDNKKCAVLQRHLTSLKATLLSDRASFSSAAAQQTNALNELFLFVPHAIPTADLPGTSNTASYSIVTEFWLEKCLHSRAFVPPTSTPLYLPFQGPIYGFDALAISSTGFEDIDLLHVGKALRELGATYEGTLSKKVSILLCNDAVSLQREKVKYAAAHNIPAVKASWLWTCMREKRSVDVKPHLLFDTDHNSPPPPKTRAGPDTSKPTKKTSRTSDLRRDALDPAETTSVPRSRRGSTASLNRPQLQTATTTFSVDDSFAVEMDEPRPIPLQERSPNTSPPKLIARLAPAAAMTGKVGIDDDDEGFHAATEQYELRGKSSVATIDMGTALSTLSTLLAAKKNRRRHESLDVSRPGSAGSAGGISGVGAGASGGLGAEASGTAAVDTLSAEADAAIQRRRRKPLRGRAASNLSGGRGPLSRTASVASVGSANTDGVGTPLFDAAGPASAGPASVGPASAGPSPLKNQPFRLLDESSLTRPLDGAADGANAEEVHGEGGRGEEDGSELSAHPPATQVSYEDNEAKRWRRELARKHGWDLQAGGKADEGEEEEGLQSSDERRLKGAGRDDGGKGGGGLGGGGGAGAGAGVGAGKVYGLGKRALRSGRG